MRKLERIENLTSYWNCFDESVRNLRSTYQKEQFRTRLPRFSRILAAMHIFNAPRKGQTEIFGLVIIVILLALGLLFAVFILTKQEATISTKESIQARTYLSTLLGTTVMECNKQSVRELLENCMDATFTSGKYIGAGNCLDGTNSCTKSKNIMALTLAETFGKWGYTYEFTIPDNDVLKTLNASNGECKSERERGIWKLIKTGRSATLTLDLC